MARAQVNGSKVFERWFPCSRRHASRLRSARVRHAECTVSISDISSKEERWSREVLGALLEASFQVERELAAGQIIGIAAPNDKIVRCGTYH